MRARRLLTQSMLVRCVAVLLAWLLAPQHALAHGIPVQAKDLPVPLSWFYAGAGSALVVSFALLGGLWRSPRLTAPAWRALPRRLDHLLQHQVIVGGSRALMAALVMLTLVAATFGTTEVGDNLAPFAVFIGFWLVLLPASVVVGDLWRAMHPAHVIGRLLGRTNDERAADAGLWWAALGIAAFAWWELVYPTASNVRLLGLLVAAWLILNVWGVRRVGTATWLTSHEPFAVYSGLLARLAPLERRDGRLGLRWPLTGALQQPPVAGLSLMCVMLIGTVSYDGLSRTRWWTVLVADATQQASSMGLEAAHARLVFGTFGLITIALFAYVAFEASCVAAAHLGKIHRRPGAPRLSDRCAPTLLPIAVGYLIAHYASFLIVQGQGLIRAMSDPLGLGWNLLGTAEMAIHSGVLSPASIWFIQVGAIVVGHVAALMLAHERALELTTSPGAAMRSQLAMLVLMLVYTVGGLYFLSEGMM